MERDFGVNMATATKKERVKGGVLVRDQKTGTLLSVSTEKSTSTRNGKTVEVILGASKKRGSAMMRLVTR